MLIQGSPPHRRARTAAWSYHFYPDEAWVDLTITLPCAILLKEVIIQPHLSSLASQSRFCRVLYAAIFLSVSNVFVCLLVRIAKKSYQ